MKGVEVKPRKSTPYTVMVTPNEEDDHEYFATYQAWYEVGLRKTVTAATVAHARSKVQEILMREAELYPILEGAGFRTILVPTSKLVGAPTARFEVQPAKVRMSK